MQNENRWLEEALATVPALPLHHAKTAKSAKTPAGDGKGGTFCNKNTFCNVQSEKKEDAGSLNNFIERAAIIEHEAGIPHEWAEAFARVCCMARPGGISRDGWQRIVDNTGRMLDSKEHLRALARFGWSIPDVFGVHPAAPEKRYDAMGLLMLMREGEVVSVINDKTIGLQRHGTGALLCYRKPLNPSPERIMLWELR